MRRNGGGRQKASRPAGLLLAFVCATALGAEELPEKQFHIQAQSVSSALRTFANQAELQLIFSEQDVRNLSSPGVNGRLSPQSALDSLLNGTDLRYEFTANNVVVVRRAPAAAVARTPTAPSPGPASRSARTAESEAARARRSATPSTGGGPLESASPPIGEVAITGSRIVRRDLEAASPVFTVEALSFEESSTIGVESVLNQLPQFVPIETQFVTGDIFPSATNTPGIGTLNMRGLGVNRTLVLFDGRRGQPANSTLVIDTNSIPATAIESVEIISGAASATYGADALGGVTNFKLRQNFQGASVELRTSTTEAGDGGESRVSALLGANIGDADQGNVMLGLEWTKRSEARISGRPFFEDALTDPGSPATALRLDYVSYEPSTSVGGLPSQAAANSLFPERAAGSTVNRSSQFYVNPDGTLFKDTGALGYNGPLAPDYKVQPSGILGQNNLDQVVSSPLTRYSIFARGHYEIAEDLKLFAQAHFVNTEVQAIQQPSPAISGFAATIPRDAQHPVPAELATLLASRGPNVYSTTQFDPNTGQPLILTGADAPWRLGRVLNFLPNRQLSNGTTLNQLMAGLEGRLPIKDWTWEAYAAHGETQTDNDYIGFASLERYRAVVSAPFYGRGFTQTGTAQTRITCTSGLPIFESFQVSQDCIDAITVDATDRTRLTQDVVEANAQGGVMDLPAGELRAAAGATWRKNDFEFRPDSIRETNSIFDIPLSTFSNPETSGSTDVKEIYAEALVPVLIDKRFAKSLKLELGARFSDYNTAGGVPTYKVLFSWAPAEGIRFRGGYQLANRAPNINELFLSAASTPVNLRGPDPCRTDTRDANGNLPSNPNRAQVQALCSAIIGTGTSTFDDNPNSFIGDGRQDGNELEIRRGNPDVQSEEGKTYTAGVVFTSPFSPGLANDLTVALDWYRARITETIATLTAQTAYDLCFNRDGISNPTYSLDDPFGMCRQILRDPVSGNRISVSAPYANLGSLETSGIDFQARWRFALADAGLENVPGSILFNLSANKLLTFKSQSFFNSAVLENAGTLARGGLFDYRIATTLRYILGNANMALHWRYLPPIDSANSVTDPLTLTQGSGSYSILNLSGGWNVNDTVSVIGGIDNLFDRDPNRVGASPTTNGAGSTVGGYYDVLGRRYYVSVKLTF
jgi:outer membrane receptor protein involved in Fe transport